jgi:hypothetical protein
MQPTLFAVIHATQAAAEYGVVAARHATSVSWEGLQQVVDGAKDYVSTHPLAVGVGAVAIVVLYRLVLSSPRVR